MVRQVVCPNAMATDKWRRNNVLLQGMKETGGESKLGTLGFTFMMRLRVDNLCLPDGCI